MAAGPAVFLPVDNQPTAVRHWQACKSLGIAQTLVTAAKLSQAIRDVSFAEDNFEFIDVSSFDTIRLQVWGVAADNDAPVIDLYGWSDQGPGNHIAKVTLAYGNFTSAASTGFHANAQAHESIRQRFAAATAYRGCDTYTVTADYEQEMISDSAVTPIIYQQYRSVVSPGTAAGASPVEADFPGYVTVDFRRSRYKFFCVACTTLAGTTLGAIFKPVLMRSNAYY